MSKEARTKPRNQLRSNQKPTSRKRENSPRELAMVDRHARIARLYLQNMTQADIARELGETQQRVSRDLAAIRERLIKSSMDDYQERLARECAKLDELERQHWEDAERFRTTDPELSRKHRQDVHAVVMSRCKLMGMLIHRLEATGHIENYKVFLNADLRELV